LSRRFVLIAVAAVVVLSVGCSSGDDAVANTTSSSVWTPTSSTVAGTPSGAGNADDGVVSMPLDAYQGIDDAEDVVGAAQERLIADCMTKQGFDYTSTNATQVPPKRIGVADDAYGISEFVDAAKVGYRGSDWNQRIAQLRQGRQARANVTPAYLAALTGSTDPAAAGGQPKGCMGDAAAAIDKGTKVSDATIAVVGEIGVDAAARTRSDPGVLDAFERWSSCMAESGFHFATPSEPAKSIPQVRIDINNLQTLPDPDPSEVAMGEADQNCKRKVGLFRIWVEAESRYQREGIKKNEAAVAELRTAIDSRVAAARRVLEGRR